MSIEEKIQTIKDILDEATRGELSSCKKCPWSPKTAKKIAFGWSCMEHGVNWEESNCRVNSMLIVQDPADTTPEKNGKLCAVHNAKNLSDKTAQQGLDLWKATVSLDMDSPEAGGYMKYHYWTNAIMHGASKSSGLRDKFKNARESCTEVLAAQIKALKPKVIIASGEVAVSSLYDIGLITLKWEDLRLKFSEGAYREKVSKWREKETDITVFCTYHTAAGVVNRTLSKRYKEKKCEIERFIREKTKGFPKDASIKAFLEKYHNMEKATHRGMRYLLNHWLDIGAEIREHPLEKQPKNIVDSD